jgi:hypothetical protein
VRLKKPFDVCESETASDPQTCGQIQFIFGAVPGGCSPGHTLGGHFLQAQRFILASISARSSSKVAKARWKFRSSASALVVSKPTFLRQSINCFLLFDDLVGFRNMLLRYFKPCLGHANIISK